MFPSNNNPPPAPHCRRPAVERDGLSERFSAVRREPPRQRQLHPPLPKLYTASIYNYPCFGRYSASSESPQFKPEGICKGVQGRLELLYEDQEKLTRAEALKRFTTMTADFLEDDYGPGGDLSDAELAEQAKAVLLPPVLIYPLRDNDNNNNEGKEETGGSSELDDNNEGKSDNQRPGIFHPGRHSSSSLLSLADKLPDEDLIAREEWTCYGSTDIEYLVLSDVDTKVSKIVAVAPRTTGVSFRTIQTDDSIRKITRVGLGILDIVHDNNSILVEEDEEDHPPHEEEDKAAVHSAGTMEEVLPRPQMDTLYSAQQSLKRTYEFSKKTAEHAKFNVEWLVSNLRDDFPARTYTAGQKIVAQLPKTVDLTLDIMTKLVRRLIGNDDDEEEDGRGRRV